MSLPPAHDHTHLVHNGKRDLTINELARRLLIKHNSAVGLVDRLVKEGLARRVMSKSDRRKVELELSARGRQVLAKLAATHRRELERIGPELKRLIGRVLRASGAVSSPFCLSRSAFFCSTR